jgi:hypothetical protein
MSHKKAQKAQKEFMEVYSWGFSRDHWPSSQNIFVFFVPFVLFVAETLGFNGPYHDKSFHVSSHRRLSR